MSLADQIRADAAGLTDFAESVTYRPYGGEPVTLTATYIDRNPIGPIGTDGGRARRFKAVIGIPRSALATVTARQDQVTIATEFGGTTTATYYVTEVVEQNDPGLWHIGILK